VLSYQCLSFYIFSGKDLNGLEESFGKEGNHFTLIVSLRKPITFCFFRLEEPLWAEMVRFIIRLFLFGVLIAYIGYSILHAINSPTINQEQTIEKDKMPLPGL
jgi:hypothetical protein